MIPRNLLLQAAQREPRCSSRHRPTATLKPPPLAALPPPALGTRPPPPQHPRPGLASIQPASKSASASPSTPGPVPHRSSQESEVHQGFQCPSHAPPTPLPNPDIQPAPNQPTPTPVPPQSSKVTAQTRPSLAQGANEAHVGDQTFEMYSVGKSSVGGEVAVVETASPSLFPPPTPPHPAPQVSHNEA